MRRTTRRFRFEFAAALLATCLSCAAQDSATVALSNGVQIEVTANFGHPTGEEALTVEMARASGNSFYRIFWDQNHLAVYAYQLAVELSAGGDSVVATAKPAGVELAQRFPQADAGKPVPTLSDDHDLGALGSGQSATLPLFTIPGMGLEVSETIRVKMNQPGGANGALRFAGIRVYLEKKLVSGSIPRVAVVGRFVMFYLPGHGGYFFSLDPVPNRPFALTANVDRRQMDFVIDNETFHVTSDAPILTKADAGPVWVYHDPDYKPSANWTLDLQAEPGSKSAADAFFTAASDTLSWWLP